MKRLFAAASLYNLKKPFALALLGLIEKNKGLLAFASLLNLKRPFALASLGLIKINKKASRLR